MDYDYGNYVRWGVFDFCQLLVEFLMCKSQGFMLIELIIVIIILGIVSVGIVSFVCGFM